jgi:hypothetical protein
MATLMPPIQQKKDSIGNCQSHSLSALYCKTARDKKDPNLQLSLSRYPSPPPLLLLLQYLFISIRFE